MPMECKVKFENNPKKVLFPGQLLRGTMELVTTNKKNVRKIYIHFYGKGKSRWTEGQGRGQRTFKGKEDYLDKCIYFIGDDSGSQDMENPVVELTPGVHPYNFEYKLPVDLPTSIETRDSYIRYTVSAVVQKPWGERIFEDTFTVVKVVDLNVDPKLREPVLVQKTVMIQSNCLLCCGSSDPLTISAFTAFGGYTPGQTISLEFDVNNESDQPVFKFTVELIRVLSLFKYADSKRRSADSMVMARTKTRGCADNRRDKIVVNLKVPPIPPTDSTSNVVKTGYIIRITGCTPVFYSHPVIALPITIGSYPLQDRTACDPYEELHSITAYLTWDQMKFPSGNGDPPIFVQTPLYDTDLDSFRPRYPVFKQSPSFESQYDNNASDDKSSEDEEV